MKSFRFVLVLFFLACFIFSVNGQKRTNKPLKKGNACKSNSISFPCPKGFQIKGSDKSSNVFVAFDSKNKIGIYAFDTTDNLSEQDLIDKTLKNALQTLYLADYKDYEWKNSDDYTDDSSWSKYETTKFAKVGFSKNKQQTIHLQFVRLSFNQKDILVGYVYEISNGLSPESEYINWDGGGNMIAAGALKDLVIKITGEKKTGKTPGGPPPGIG